MNRVSAVGTGEGGFGAVRVTVRRSPNGERIVHVSGELVSDAVPSMSQLLAEQFTRSSPVALHWPRYTHRRRRHGCLDRGRLHGGRV